MAPRSVVIGATQVPFQHGGAEWHAEALLRQLKARGFLAELVQLPFQWDPREAALRSALAWRLLDFHQAGGQPIDLFVGTRFPSYAARHPNKVVWLFHQFRQAYDLHEAGLDGFPDTPEGRALRQHVIALDTQALRECRRIFTTSRNNAARLRRFNGLEAELLPLPLEEPQAFRSAAPEPFVLSVGRLVSLKRVDLLLLALVPLLAQFLLCALLRFAQLHAVVLADCGGVFGFLLPHLHADVRRQTCGAVSAFLSLVSTEGDASARAAPSHS